jgi:hypothetical protein
MEIQLMVATVVMGLLTLLQGRLLLTAAAGLVTFGKELGAALLREQRELAAEVQEITLLGGLTALLTLEVAVEQEVPQVVLA